MNYDYDFLKKYQKARDEKDSILCAGFDPAIPNQREKNVIAKSYFEERSIVEGILAFFDDFLESVQDYCCAIKPNNQYIFHIGLDAYKKINKKIHDQGLVSILDQKIGDIGSTNESGFYWMKEMGFDAVTYSPFAGNIDESLNFAHNFSMGLIALCLMSNPDAIYFMKNSIVEGQKGYQFIAQKIGELKGDGVVVGATGHVTSDDIQTIRKLTGDKCIMLIPGIGKQQGDLRKVIENGGENVLLNVSRAILYSENLKDTAKEYNDQFNAVRKEK
ncbi:MAG: orotidine-5'-phosphate decarboxylase [Asgard group archaeon]|nr:orotidine-5'-phosphate decarboxylase [Asgard group archaeon]